MQMHEWVPLPKVSLQPLTDAITAFTDAGRRSMKAVAVWHDGRQWCHKLLNADPMDSLQTLELLAVVWVLCAWEQDHINIVTDSLYVAGVAQRIETARIKDVQNQRLFLLL
ncbi:POK7 protein, partial [Nycticryphes semicollaris]|nr:POK7 protein [Nycticryphes semicollaris]